MFPYIVYIDNFILDNWLYLAHEVGMGLGVSIMVSTAI